MLSHGIQKAENRTSIALDELVDQIGIVSLVSNISALATTNSSSSVGSIKASSTSNYSDSGGNTSSSTSSYNAQGNAFSYYGFAGVFNASGAQIGGSSYQFSGDNGNYNGLQSSSDSSTGYPTATYTQTVVGNYNDREANRGTLHTTSCQVSSNG